MKLRTRTGGGTIYLGVVGAALLGLAVIAVGMWRSGVAIMGSGLLVGALARAVLSEPAAGMLRVRRLRAVDVATLAAVGAALIALAIAIPNQPGS